MASHDENSRKLSFYFTPLKPPTHVPALHQPTLPPAPPPPPPLQTTPSLKPAPAPLPSPSLQITPLPPTRSCPTPHPQVTVDPVKIAHIPSLMRITGLLLPIRYPTSFYSSIITDPLIASLSKVAVYHDHPATGSNSTENSLAGNSSSSGNTDKVIGGIRCRLEPCQDGNKPSTATNLYIQTLHLLSPFRGRGIAAALLHSLIYDDNLSASYGDPPSVSALVKHYGIRTVTAHVHVTNSEALDWYTARGFKIQDEIIEGYYRKLKPGGARVVRLDLAWDDSEGIHQDDEWEKVDSADCPSPETLGEYEQVQRDKESQK